MLKGKNLQNFADVLRSASLHVSMFKFVLHGGKVKA